jgi:hypothetical protein
MIQFFFLYIFKIYINFRDFMCLDFLSLFCFVSLIMFLQTLQAAHRQTQTVNRIIKIKKKFSSL